MTTSQITVRLAFLPQQLFCKAMLAICLTVASSHVAAAIDGYKSYTFGLSEEQVTRQCPVQLQHGSNDGWADTYGDTCRVLIAMDFPFMKSAREVDFVFVDAKLAAVAFVLKPAEFLGVLDPLSEKYKPDEMQLSPELVRKQCEGLDSRVPGSELVFRFAENSILAITRVDDGGVPRHVLLYRDTSIAPPRLPEGAAEDL